MYTPIVQTQDSLCIEILIEHTLLPVIEMMKGCGKLKIRAHSSNPLDTNYRKRGVKIGVQPVIKLQ